MLIRIRLTVLRFVSCSEDLDQFIDFRSVTLFSSYKIHSSVGEVLQRLGSGMGFYLGMERVGFEGTTM